MEAMVDQHDDQQHVDLCHNISQTIEIRISLSSLFQSRDKKRELEKRNGHAFLKIADYRVWEISNNRHGS